MHTLIIPGLVSFALILSMYFVGGFPAVLITALLVVLEVTLSFDNAVVNAKVLTTMSHKWQQRFLTWGMLIAVFGTRFIFPILIVSASVLIDPWTVAKLALFAPSEYGAHLHDAHYAIAGFGALFLLMVSLKFFIDSAKEHHWFDALEKHLRLWGKIEAVEIAIALVALLGITRLVGEEHASIVLTSGIIGIVLFILMQGIASYFSIEAKSVATQGLALFLYLQVLDTAFSLDSVVGAFALTTSIPVIMVGLGIGAYFVRWLTLYFVEHKTLATLVFLEHGAHYAIFGLAISMLVSLVTPVPEIITGGIGLLFVVLAYYSSLRARPLTAS